MKTTFSTIIGMLAVLTMASIASASNIVSNPGFEIRNADWVKAQWYIAPAVWGIGDAYGGEYFASTRCAGSDCVTAPTAYLYQDLATIPGQAYTLTFWYDLGVCQAPLVCGLEELKVLWNGTSVFDLATTPSGYTDPGWLQATVSSLQATSTSTRLEFTGRQDSAMLGLDDVSVVAAAVPEPSGMILLGSGLAILIAFARHRLH